MGATEMYNLDFNTRVTTLDRAFLEELQQKGYLHTIPLDPGGGAESWSNYYFYEDPERSARDPWGSWQIMCLRHGFIIPPQGTEHEDGGLRQLAALGVDPGREPVGPVLGWMDSGLAGPPRRDVLGLVEVPALIAQVAAGVAMPVSMIFFVVLCMAEAFAWVRGGPPWRAAAPGPEGGVAPVDLARARCPVCADGFGVGTPVAALCPDCRTPHHEPCLRYIGHCAVFACSRTELTERRRREAIDEKARTATG